MTEGKFTLTRRTLLGAAAGGAALSFAPGLIRHAAAASKEFRIGVFVPLSGPASLFGPGNRAAAELGADEANKKGGILGRQIKLYVADAGGPPADTAKSAVRMMLEDDIDLAIGSHDSATMEALVSTFKGKIPYVYTPVYQGDECAFNVYCLGETPAQQVGPGLKWLTEKKHAKTYYLIGDDYVWPRKTNEAAKKFIAEDGGKVIGEEYVPFGAPNKFEQSVTRIKGAKPDVVLITLVGADNVNFNRTFAGFGLDKSMTRFSLLLEAHTLEGIGAEASKDLYSCMDYFAEINTPDNEAFKKAYFAKFGAKAPLLSDIGVDTYAGINFAKALVDKVGSTNGHKCMKASEGLRFMTASGPAVMHGRQVTKTMYLADCNGGKFHIVDTFKNVKAGTVCKV